MQIHPKTEVSGSVGDNGTLGGLVKQTSISGMEDNIDEQVKAALKMAEKDLEPLTQQEIANYCHLKYQYDHAFVIGDNNLKHNVEVMIGKQNLYCSFHDIRNAENQCEHIRFIKMLDETKKLLI
ncbi:MAG TPA: hypothetical protein VJR94_07090 [Candidatus Nitrosocosmicus sp.]|nr:hypothetical protein [Candidatus Nitrosocosmicus sp.]